MFSSRKKKLCAIHDFYFIEEIFVEKSNARKYLSPYFLKITLSISTNTKSNKNSIDKFIGEEDLPYEYLVRT